MFLSLPQWACLFVVTSGTASDYLYRRIPNGITIPAIISAFIYHGWTREWMDGVIHSVAGLVVGCALLIWFFAKGVMGGGDVKLLGALGAWLGSEAVVNIFIYSAWVGALMALWILVLGNTTMSMSKRVSTVMDAVSAACKMQRMRGVHQEMPYAFAIAVGYGFFLFYGRLV